MRGHLQADAGYQERLIRFIENHDEPRAAATFGAAQARAAAVVMSTLQGARLYHDGQLDGRRTRIPVFLGRGPDEPPDERPARLLRAAAARGRRLASCAAATGGCASAAAGPTTTPTASSSPGAGRRRTHATSSWSTSPPRPRQARVHLPWEDLAGRTWKLTDRLSGQRFERDGDELAGAGLYVALEAWASHFLSFEGGTGTGVRS